MKVRHIIFLALICAWAFCFVRWLIPAVPIFIGDDNPDLVYEMFYWLFWVLGLCGALQINLLFMKDKSDERT